MNLINRKEEEDNYVVFCVIIIHAGSFIILLRYKFCVQVAQYLESCLMLYLMVGSESFVFDLERKFVKQLNVRMIYRLKYCIRI